MVLIFCTERGVLLSIIASAWDHSLSIIAKASLACPAQMNRDLLERLVACYTRVIVDMLKQHPDTSQAYIVSRHKVLGTSPTDSSNKLFICNASYMYTKFSTK